MLGSWCVSLSLSLHTYDDDSPLAPTCRSQPSSLRNAPLFSNGAGFLIRSAVDPYFFSVLSVSLLHCLRLASRTASGRCSLHDAHKARSMETSASCMRSVNKNTVLI